jgi:nucleotide-binding universal stress UspA family protein
MSTTIDQAAATESTQRIFRRILVGIDHSPESLEAARQAAILATGPVTLLAAYERDLSHAIAGAGMAPVPPVMLDEAPVRERAEEALERAKRVLGSTEAVSKLVYGRAWEVLHYEIARTDDTLVAVGSHGAGRAKGIVIGSTATELLHKAPCSVLVARKPLKTFPSSIVVGVDDSWQGARADAVARGLAERFGAELDRYENVRHPMSSLVEAAIEADLLVVGSRRLQGLKALGSVSERVAHEARCSVLVVR